MPTPQPDTYAHHTALGGSDLTKIGAGELVLSGQNLYRGSTNINQGTLTTESSGQLEIVMSRYYAFGGIGTYLIQATATRNGETITAQQTFLVTSARGIY